LKSGESDIVPSVVPMAKGRNLEELSEELPGGRVKCRKCTGIEANGEYVKITKRRLDAFMKR